MMMNKMQTLPQSPALWCFLLALTVGCTQQPTSVIRFTVATPIKIAIIDTGYKIQPKSAKDHLKLCQTGHYDYRSDTPTVGYTHRHGQNVATILSRRLNDVDYCALVYQIVNPASSQPISTSDIADAIYRAKAEGAVAINISLTGIEYAKAEYAALKSLANTGTYVFVAGGNSNRDLSTSCNSYPSCYNLPHVISVGAFNRAQFIKEPYSNFGGPVKLWYPGNSPWAGDTDEGTSFASPRALSDYVLLYSRMRSILKTPSLMIEQ